MLTYQFLVSAETSARVSRISSGDQNPIPQSPITPEIARVRPTRVWRLQRGTRNSSPTEPS